MHIFFIDNFYIFVILKLNYPQSKIEDMMRISTAVSIIITLNFLIIQTIFANIDKPQDTFIVGVQSNNDIAFDGYKNKFRCEKIFFDFLLTFAKNNNFNLEYRELNKTDRIHSFLNHDIDFRFPDNPTWSAATKRNQEVIYSDPIYYYVEGLFIRNEDVEKFNHLKDIKKIGIAGDVVPWFLHHNVEIQKMKLVQLPKNRLLMKALLSGEVDAAYSDFYLGDFTINELELENKITFAKNLPNINDYYYLSTIKHPEIVDKFNLWMHDHIHDLKKVIKECHSGY